MSRVLRGLYLATLCGITVFASAPIFAQETQPGDPCLPAQTNQMKRSGGPELGGNLYEIRCDGSTWRTFLSAVGGGNIGIGTDSPSQSALLDLQSSDKGFLPPRLTEAQRNAITEPLAGLIIFNTSLSKLEVFDGGSWQSLADGAGGGGGGTAPSGENLVVAYRSGDFSITSSQASHLFLVDSAALALLPALSSVEDGFRIYIKRTGFGNVTVAPASGDDIEGMPSMSIGFQGGLLEMVATPSRWELLRAGTAGGGGDPSACPAGSVSYGTGEIGMSEFNITQAMVDHCIFSVEVKGAGGGVTIGGAGGGIAFNWTPTDAGKLGIFVGEGGFRNSSGAAGGLGGGGGGDLGGGGGASAVRFFETDSSGTEIPGSSVVLAVAGGGGGSGPSSSEQGGQGGSIGAGFNGQGPGGPGGGAPGNGSGGTRGSGSRYGGSGGSAGNNGGLSSYQSPPAALGVPAFNIGGGGAGYGTNGGGGGGGYGGGGGGYDAGGGGGAGFLLSSISISNGTSITGGAPGAQTGEKGEDGSVTIIITGR